MITPIHGLGQFKTFTEKMDGPVVFLFHGSFSPTSEKLRQTLEELSLENDCSDGCTLAAVNLDEVKDVHGSYRVESAPTILIFRKGKEAERLIGEQSRDVLKKAILGAKRQFESAEAGSKPKFPPVTVYTTPTCGFCTKIKNHLKNHGVPYKEIDIAKDSKAGEALVKKTGQQGVPQTFIGNEFIIGFDQQKIDRLLGL